MNSNVVTIGIIALLAVGSVAITDTTSQVTKITPNKIRVRTKNLVINKIKIDTLLSKIDTISKDQEKTKNILLKSGKLLDNTLLSLKNEQKYIVQDCTKINQILITDTIFVHKVIEVEESKDSLILIKKEKFNFFQRDRKSVV